MFHNTAHPLLKSLRTDQRGWAAIYYVIAIFILYFVLAGCTAVDRKINLVFLGDVMPGRGVTLTDSSFSYLEPVIRASDFALFNLESALTNSPVSKTEGYSLCAPPGGAQTLADAGLDLVSIYNNHRVDCGLQGTQDTINNLQAAGLTPLDPQGYTTTKHEIKLSFFAFDDISSPMDLSTATGLIQAARSDGAIVIISMHWGAEYQAAASERQRWLAGQLSAAGASLIWGHHPHVLQPIEWLPADCAGSQDRTGCALVIYSLGNALFDQGGLADTRRSALISILLDQNGVQSYQAIPFMIDPANSLVEAPNKSESDLILSRLHLLP
jgi:poly-gamma-glutamate synthesis protein (capsule biosynthesis protein)